MNLVKTEACASWLVMSKTTSLAHTKENTKEGKTKLNFN